MSSMTEKDRRTLRFAAIGIGIYLVLFGAFRGVAFLESKRVAYEKMVARAQNLEREFRPIENRVLLLEKLKQRSRVDPSRWTRSSLVAEASAAIQRAAAGGGVQMGPMREMPGRPSARELSSISIEGTGPLQPMLELIPKIETLGYPLVVDSVQFTADPMRPGMLKVNLTVTILDVEQWKNDDASGRAGSAAVQTSVELGSPETASLQNSGFLRKSSLQIHASPNLGCLRNSTVEPEAEFSLEVSHA